MEEIKVVCYEINGKTFYSICTNYLETFHAFNSLYHYVKNIRMIEENEFWSTVHAVIRYNRKNSPQPLFEVCMTESDLVEKRISLLFDQEIDNLEVLGGGSHVD